MTEIATRARRAVTTWGEGETTVHALDTVDVEFERGAFTCSTGPSGSGRSTLMHCMAGLDGFTSGQVRVPAHNRPSAARREECTTVNTPDMSTTTSPPARVPRRRARALVVLLTALLSSAACSDNSFETASTTATTPAAASEAETEANDAGGTCLLYTSPSPRD